MRVTTLALPLALPLALSAPPSAFGASAPVGEVANIRFYSDELMNLHHDRVNRAWSADIGGRVASLRDEVVARLGSLCATRWFSTPERADIVWVGNRAGGYATSGPTHATISSTHPTTQGWKAVETVFHEYSHILVDGLFRKLNAALGDGRAQHAVLWHVVQFHLTGEAVREALARRDVLYEPSIEELFGRAWPQYRQPVKDAWGPHLAGRATMDDAIAWTVAALKAPK